MLKAVLQAMHTYVGYVIGPLARNLLITVLCLMDVNSGTTTFTTEEWAGPKDWNLVYILYPGRRSTGLGKRRVPKEIRKVIFLKKVLGNQKMLSSCFFLDSWLLIKVAQDGLDSMVQDGH